MKRFFGHSSVVLHKRTAPFLLKRVKVPIDKTKNYEINQLPGIGLNRFSNDLQETMTWTCNLLTKLKEESFTFKEFEWKKDAICVEYRDEYCYDFSQKQPLNNYVAFHVPIDSLDLSPKQQHSLLLLIGDLYDPFTNSFVLEAKTVPELSLDEGFDRFQALKLLQKQLKLLIDTSKENDEFKHIKLDLRHVIVEKKYEYPSQWLGQQLQK